MATFQKVPSFTEALAHKKHNLSSDTLKIMLTLTNPATAAVKADLTDISAGNGYTAGGATASLVSSGQTGGTYKLVLNDVTFTASGGDIGPFRYVVLYNDTASNKELVGYWDNGENLTILDTQYFKVDLNQSAGVFTNT